MQARQEEIHLQQNNGSVNLPKDVLYSVKEQHKSFAKFSVTWNLTIILVSGENLTYLFIKEQLMNYFLLLFFFGVVLKLIK